MDKFATAINCMDGRAQLPVTKFLKSKYQVDYVDMITLPGPEKVLFENSDTVAIESIKRCVRISIDNHGSKLIAICGHFDCAGNPAEKDAKLKQVFESVEMIRSWEFDASVIGLLVNPDWLVEEV